MDNLEDKLKNHVVARLLNIESRIAAVYDSGKPFFDYSKPLEDQWIEKELFEVIKLYFDERDKIVHCRDCVDCNEEGIYTPQYYCLSRHWNSGWWGTPTDPDGFCKWGKRREE